MKSHNMISALLLSAAVLLPVSAFATNVPVVDNGGFGGDDSGVLHSKAKWNRDLEEGDYAFAATHWNNGKGFFDEWKFTLAEDSDVTISLTDINIPLNGATPLKPYVPVKHGSDKGHGNDHHGNGNWWGNSDKLLDNKFLTVSLFDKEGTLLGTAGEGGTLSALNLLAGQWYTLTVSGKASGIFGGAYYGNLEVSGVSEVPIGDTLPLLGSALLVLMIRGRKTFTRMGAV